MIIVRWVPELHGYVVLKSISIRYRDVLGVILNSGPGARKSLRQDSRASGPLFNTTSTVFLVRWFPKVPSKVLLAFVPLQPLSLTKAILAWLQPSCLCLARIALLHQPSYTPGVVSKLL